MKTPEQLAVDWANAESDLWFADISTYTDGHKSAVKQGFLAGYQAAMNSPENSDSSDDSDTPDLQEQLEALHQYMTVAQRKIMVLQANVEFLLYHNKEKMGESEAIRRMQQTIQGFGRKDE